MSNKAPRRCLPSEDCAYRNSVSAHFVPLMPMVGVPFLKADNCSTFRASRMSSQSSEVGVISPSIGKKPKA